MKGGQLKHHHDPVDTMLEEFKNATLFPPLGLPTTLIRHENETFSRKRSPNWSNLYLKKPTFPFRVDRKQSEKGAFWKRWRHDNRVIFLTEFFSSTNPKWPVIVFKFLQNQCGRETFDEFSDWNLRFKIPPAQTRSQALFPQRQVKADWKESLETRLPPAYFGRGIWRCNMKTERTAREQDANTNKIFYDKWPTGG